MFWIMVVVYLAQLRNFSNQGVGHGLLSSGVLLVDAFWAVMLQATESLQMSAGERPV